MNKKKERITIGITCFNAEKSIENAIDSALNQTWENKEIIIVDDGSTDYSSNIINSKIKNKNIIFLKNKQNKGTSFSRNLIIDKSTSEIICFMDDDDYSENKRVEKQFEELKKNGYPKSKYIACCTGIRKKYQNGYIKNFWPMGTNGRIPKENELVDFLLFYEKKKEIDYGFGMPTCCLMITKSCFKMCGQFDLNLKRVEDMDLSIRLSFNKVIFSSVKELLVTQNLETFSKNKSIINFNSEVYLFNKNKKYLENKGLFKYSILWSELRFNYFKYNYVICFKLLIILIFMKPLRTFKHFSSTAFKRFLHDIKNNSISMRKFIYKSSS